MFFKQFNVMPNEFARQVNEDNLNQGGDSALCSAGLNRLKEPPVADGGRLLCWGGMGGV